MRLLAYLVLGLVLLVVLRAAVVLAASMAGLVLVIGLVFAPRQTLITLLATILILAFAMEPLAGLVLATTVLLYTLGKAA
jgi:hypothetical protein|tara:strand:+ start:8049 stop:8288 length:240 start_codon:yes stop_codon:yes gene_type:complete